MPVVVIKRYRVFGLMATIKANDCVHINATGHIEIACLKKRRDQRKNHGGFRRRTQKGGGVHR